MVVQQVRFFSTLILVCIFTLLQSFSDCEVIENPKWKKSKLYLSLIEGQIKLPYYIPSKASNFRSSSASIHFPPPGVGNSSPQQQPSWPSYPPASNSNYPPSNSNYPPNNSNYPPSNSNYPTYPSRNVSSIPESPSWMPPSRYPQPPRGETFFPDANAGVAGGNNRYNSSGGYPSYPNYPSSPSYPSYPNGATGTSTSNQPKGPPQESPKWPSPGPQPQPPISGGGKSPKPSNPSNNSPTPDESSSNHSKGTETSEEESSEETTPGKPTMTRPKPSFPSGGKHPSSPSKPSDHGSSSGGKHEPATNTSLELDTESETLMTTESTEDAGNSSSITCTSTKAENHKFDFPYLWKIDGFFDYASACEKFKDPFVFKLRNLQLQPQELQGNWSITLSQETSLFNNSNWALNVTYETEDDAKTYFEVHLDAKVGRKIFLFPAVTANHSSHLITTTAESDDQPGPKGPTMHSYVALWPDIKYDKHGESIRGPSALHQGLELNFNFETVIVHKVVNSSSC